VNLGGLSTLVDMSLMTGELAALPILFFFLVWCMVGVSWWTRGKRERERERLEGAY